MEGLWWNQVTNAVKLVSDIERCLLEEKSLILMYSTTMPWREKFEESIRGAVKLHDPDKKFEKVPIVDDPGEHLLKEFCKKEKRAEYRPSKRHAKFFAASDDIVLHDRYLWVKTDTEACLEKWLDFVSEYIKERGKEDKKAVFILEFPNSTCTHIRKGIKGIKVFSFDDYIGEYDRIVFSVLASSTVKENIFLKDYLTELVSNVAGNDIELCAECILEYKSFMAAPGELIKKTVEEKVRSNGERFVFRINEEEIEHLIWLAQIKTVYPKLEEYREGFVSRYLDQIAKNLPIEAAYGEVYTDPKDVELGTLAYMAQRKMMSLDKAEFDKLLRYKDARNSLSHLKALSIEEVKKLIS